LTLLIKLQRNCSLLGTILCWNIQHQFLALPITMRQNMQSQILTYTPQWITSRNTMYNYIHFWIYRDSVNHQLINITLISQHYFKLGHLNFSLNYSSTIFVYWILCFETIKFNFIYCNMLGVFTHIPLQYLHYIHLENYWDNINHQLNLPFITAFP